MRLCFVLHDVPRFRNPDRTSGRFALRRVRGHPGTPSHPTQKATLFPGLGDGHPLRTAVYAKHRLRRGIRRRRCLGFEPCGLLPGVLRYPPFLFSARGGNVFRPAEMHRRGRARGHQRRDPPAAADAAALCVRRIPPWPVRVRPGRPVTGSRSRIPDGPRRAENRGIDAFAFAAHRIPHPHGQNVLRRIVRTLDHAPPDEQPHRGRVPRVLHVVVGHEMRLPRREPFPERPVRLKRIVEFAAFRHDGPFRRRVPEVPQHPPPELLRLFPRTAAAPPAPCCGRRAAPARGSAGRSGSSAPRSAAHFASARSPPRAWRCSRGYFRDAVLHFQRGRAPAVVNLPEARGEMVLQWPVRPPV